MINDEALNLILLLSGSIQLALADLEHELKFQNWYDWRTAAKFAVWTRDGKSETFWEILVFLNPPRWCAASFAMLFMRRSALTEVSVLCDVLGIARQKHYLVLDPVSQEPSEHRPVAVLVAKKKVALFTTAFVLPVSLGFIFSLIRKKCDFIEMRLVKKWFVSLQLKSAYNSWLQSSKLAVFQVIDFLAYLEARDAALCETLAVVGSVPFKPVPPWLRKGRNKSYK